MLADGELVSFAHASSPYVAQPDSNAESGGVCTLTLGLSRQEAAVLKVVHEGSGHWLGFRSKDAGGRFLQLSRRRGQKLLLFNRSFGTNEQWLLVRAPKQPWERAELHFRHRRFTV